MNAKAIVSGLLDKSDSTPSMPVPATDPAFDEAPGYFRHFIAHYWQPLAKEVHSMGKLKRNIERVLLLFVIPLIERLPDWVQALLGGQ
jgi:hypothetical protein